MFSGYFTTYWWAWSSYRCIQSVIRECRVMCLLSKLISYHFHIFIESESSQGAPVTGDYPLTQLSLSSNISISGSASCPSSPWPPPTPRDTSATSRTSQRPGTLRTSPSSRRSMECSRRLGENSVIVTTDYNLLAGNSKQLEG